MLSKKVFHAVNALVVMACLPAGNTITTAELASQVGLSVSYVESLLKALREHGFVRATRGPGGGYDLAISADRMSVWSVVAALDPYPENPAAEGEALIDLEQALGQAMERELQAFLSSTFIADHVNAESALTIPRKAKVWDFGFKPLVQPWRPEAPNSVFQLSQFVAKPMAKPAAAWRA
jgi:Rrf2 family iron-sulfur cluster assembly transcriptional regulator